MPLIYKSNWWGYLLKRVIAAIISLFIISLIIFFLTTADFSGNFGSTFMKPYSPEAERIIKEYHFDEPYLIYYFRGYFRWLGGIFKGDFSESLNYYE